MEKLKYAEIVIKEVHSRTTQGTLKWEDKNHVSLIAAQPTPAIGVSIRYVDNGPDGATWEYAKITHPVGIDETMIGNPASSRARSAEVLADSDMLEQLNEIFRLVLLDPRQRDFEVAMKQLLEA